MFPVNSRAFLICCHYPAEGVCTLHLIRPPCEKHSCAPSIANDFLDSATSLPPPTHPRTHAPTPTPPPPALTDPSCLKCCSNCPIDTPYVNCITARKQEEKTSNRHNQPLQLLRRLICQGINTDDDTARQQRGRYHLSSPSHQRSRRP